MREPETGVPPSEAGGAGMDLKARKIASELQRGLRVSRKDQEYLLEQLIENGLTEEDMKEVFDQFVDNVNKELGLEDEMRFTEYKKQQENAQSLDSNLSLTSKEETK